MIDKHLVSEASWLSIINHLALSLMVKDKKKSLEQYNKENDRLDYKVVYIAGKVTGLPYEEVVAKFSAKHKMLEKAGYQVINPCLLIDEKEDWRTAMIICFELLPYAHYICLCDDWQDSKGATMEKEYAEKLGIQILSV